jgi:DNA polymerase-3 subunit delta
VKVQELKEIKSLSPVYLLQGVNSFLLKDAKQKIIEKTLTEEEQEFNLASFDLEEIPIETVIEDAETLPFLGKKRVVIAENATFLTAEKQKVEHNVDVLIRYLEEPAPFSVLIIVAPYEKLDERKKVTKKLKAKSTHLEANELTEGELKNWVKAEVAQAGLTITDEALSEFIELTGMKLTIVHMELAKLLLYGEEITAELVHQLVSKSLEQNVFALVEAFIHGRTVDTITIYRDLLRNNEEPIKILALLVSQIRLVYHSKRLSNQGYGQKQISQALKVHPFRVKLAIGQGRSFSTDHLLNLLKDLARADFEMKTGKMDKALLLELLFMKKYEA